jgi:TPR repeat protein
VTPDLPLALRWYDVAVARGSTDAAASRDALDRNGFARSEDDALAAAMEAYKADDFAAAFAQLEPLAVAGDAVAQLYLGELYRSGRGTDADPVRAHIWLSLAADRLAAGADRDRAATDRDAVARQLTGVQLSEAQRRAREWTPSAS